MKKRILVPVAQEGFDPSEASVPWKILSAAGHEPVFATPTGKPAEADPRMLHGTGLGPLKGILRADPNARAAFAALSAAPAFLNPLTYEAARAADFDALVLPGGHAKGMRVYLESTTLHGITRDFFAAGKPVGAICHGVVLAARARDAQGRSVLFGKKTTALTRRQELLAWRLTRLWLGDYYRTYPETVEDEVRRALASPDDFLVGPNAVRRDRPERLDLGFIVQDGPYVSARWPGDAHRFGEALREILSQ